MFGYTYMIYTYQKYRLLLLKFKLGLHWCQAQTEPKDFTLKNQKNIETSGEYKTPLSRWFHGWNIVNICNLTSLRGCAHTWDGPIQLATIFWCQREVEASGGYITPLSGWFLSWTIVHPCHLDLGMASELTQRMCAHLRWSNPTCNNFLMSERSWGLWRLHNPLGQVVSQLDHRSHITLGPWDGL